MNKEEVAGFVKPESQIEKKIVADSEFIEGAIWGKPRNGHPEGEVAHHIADVLSNIDKFFPTDQDREKLRFIAITHDSFKYKVDTTQPKFGENHHAMIARRFAEKFTDESDVLDIIELHDEIYNSYNMEARRNNKKGAEKRVSNLLNKLGDNFDLFVKFAKCDSDTGNKDASCNVWFRNLMLEKYNRQISL